MILFLINCKFEFWSLVEEFCLLLDLFSLEKLLRKWNNEWVNFNFPSLQIFWWLNSSKSYINWSQLKLLQKLKLMMELPTLPSHVASEIFESRKELVVLKILQLLPLNNEFGWTYEIWHWSCCQLLLELSKSILYLLLYNE